MNPIVSSALRFTASTAPPVRAELAGDVGRPAMSISRRSAPAAIAVALIGLVLVLRAYVIMRDARAGSHDVTERSDIAENGARAVISGLCALMTGLFAVVVTTPIVALVAGAVSLLWCALYVRSMRLLEGERPPRGGGEGSVGENFWVHINSPATRPKELARQLGAHVTQYGGRMRIVLRDANGMRVGAFDAGGPRRQIWASLFEGLFIGADERLEGSGRVPHRPPAMRIAEIDGHRFPLLDPTDPQSRRDYWQIGRVMGASCRPEWALPIGRVFSDAFFQGLKVGLMHCAFRNDRADAEAKVFCALQGRQVFSRILNGDRNFTDDEIHGLAWTIGPHVRLEDNLEFVRDGLAREGLPTLKRAVCNTLRRERNFNELVQPIMEMAQGIQATFYGRQQGFVALARLSADELNARIQGRLSRQDVLRALPAPPRCWRERQTHGFLEAWVCAASEVQLEAFVRAVFGGSSIPEGADVGISYEQVDMGRRPVAHTCSSTLDLPTRYVDQDMFNARMEDFLAHAAEFGIR